MEIPLQSLLMFKSWPSIKINKNDTEAQMFAKYYNCVNKNEITYHMANNFDEEQPKSKNVATVFRNKGNNCYKILDYENALNMYNISLSRAPRDSTEFALAMANRSAVLFDLKKYKECLLDINTVLKSEYPKNLMYKVFLRQSKCFVEINLIEEAVEALNKTKESFNKEKKSLGNAQIALMNDSIKNVSSDINEKKSNQSLNCQDINNNLISLPHVRDGENPKYLSASNVVNFSFITDTERCVKATKDIKKGDILFVEKPYASCGIKNEKYEFSVCYYCLKTSENCLPCATCTTYFYCSYKCQRESWELDHKWLCYNERHQLIIDSRQKLALSILIKASQEGFDTHIADTSIYGNKDNNYPYFDKLLTHKNKLPDLALEYDIKSAIWIVLYLKNFTDYFNWLYVHPNRPTGSKDELLNIVGSHILKYLLILRCNMDVITKGFINTESEHDIELVFASFGTGIFVSSALLNHSCLPNASLVYYNNVKVVKALKDIKSGTEITINYLPGQLQGEDKNERQNFLKRWMFKCSCIVCTSPDYEDKFTPYLCPRCRGKAFPFRGPNLKCSHCQMVINKNRFHARNEEKIAHMLLLLPFQRNIDQKNALYTLMKKTYHKDHILYTAYYLACRKNFESKGEFHKCLEPMKNIVDTAENIYGNTSRQYLMAVLQATFVFGIYGNIMKTRNPEYYEKFSSGAQECLQKSIDCLQYFVDPESIDHIIKTFDGYISSGNTMSLGDNDEVDEDDDEVDDIRNMIHFFNLLR